MLLEREPELQAIDTALDRLGAGTGSLLLIEGPAGIGKTRLLAEAIELARKRDLVVRSARGGELERELPFGVARELLDPVLDGSSAEASARLLSGSARFALLALGREDPEGRGSTVDPAAPIHGLYWLLSNVAERRALVLVVDDAHWADPETLRFLVYLSRRIGGLPVLALAAVRTGEPDEPQEIKQLRLEAEVLELRSLSLGAIGDVVTQDLGVEPSQELVEACAEATAGNPFLLVEVLRAIRADALDRGDAVEAITSLGPRRVAQHVLVRIGRFGEEAVALAHAIAVLGGAPQLRHAAALAGLDESGVRSLCDRLRQAEILAPGHPIDFVHPLVREAVYRDLSEGARSDLHRRAAQILLSTGASAREMAPHLLACEPNGDQWVVDRLREAAVQAMADGAYDAARSYMERALREPSADEARDRFLLGRATYETDASQALPILDAAVEAATDPALRVEALRWSANACLLMGNFAGVLDRIRRVLELLPEGEREQALALEAQTAGFTFMTEGRSEESSRRIRELAGDLEGRTPGERVARQALSAELFFACEPVERVIQAASLFPPAPWEIAGYRDPIPMAASKVLSWCGRWDDAAREIQAYGQVSEGRGRLHASAAGHAAVAEVWRLAGRLPDAEVEARTAIEITAARPTFSIVALGARMGLVAILLERGDLDAASELAEGLPMWLAPPEMWLPPWPTELRGYLKLAQGDLEGGVAALLELLEPTESLRAVNPAMSPWRRQAAPVLVALGRTAEAKELLQAEEERARSFGAPHVIGAVLRARASLEPQKRRIETLRQSISALEEYGPPHELARSLIDLGAALRRDGQRSEAREPLRRGLELAHRSDARPLEDRAREELAAAGARPRTPVLSGPASLTPSELRTAKLAAEGLSNRDIAQRLFVTLRTVETHLTHAYGKLQIAGREELKPALAEVG